MFFAALGCNLAWGYVDAMIYLVQTLTERGYRLDLLRRVRTAAEPAQAHRVIADSMPLLAAHLTVADLALAMRVSNGIAIGMMFFAGWGLGRYAGFRPVWTGLSILPPLAGEGAYEGMRDLRQRHAGLTLIVALVG